jgi:hypothetical protein
MFILHEKDFHVVWDFHEPGNIIAMILYWGLANYFGNGQTPGKWVARTRVVSLTSERIGLWQSVERGLGYGAAVLEGGIGLLQFFWDPNRMCAQDRLAETIVIDVRKPKPDKSEKQALNSENLEQQEEVLSWKFRFPPTRAARSSPLTPRNGNHRQTKSTHHNSPQP